MNMSSQILNNVARIIFLKKFTYEILHNLIKKEQVEKHIEVERLKQKFFKPKFADEELKKMIRQPIFETMKYSQSPYIINEIKQRGPLNPPLIRTPRINSFQKPIAQQTKTLIQPIQQKRTLRQPIQQRKPYHLIKLNLIKLNLNNHNINYLNNNRLLLLLKKGQKTFS